jgi:hypothetical protein
MAARSVVLWVVKMGHSTVDSWVESLVGLWVAMMVGLMADTLADTMVALTADALAVMLDAQTAFPLVEKTVVKWADV